MEPKESHYTLDLTGGLEMSFPQHTREQCECTERLPGIHLEWMRRCAARAVLRLVACRSRKPGSTQISAALLLSFICPALPTISSRVQPPLPAEQLHLENQFHTSHKIHRDLSFKKPTNQTITFFLVNTTPGYAHEPHWSHSRLQFPTDHL